MQWQTKRKRRFAEGDSKKEVLYTTYTTTTYTILLLRILLPRGDILFIIIVPFLLPTFFEY